ncbi:hypothetical protein AB3K92_13300 [Burkholderia sp. Bmkn7]|uniref:hypothetical protein n=1 Tax=Burkholderia sp. Bmkn7 TaxID=3236841 RepID=UPI0034E41235
MKRLRAAMATVATVAAMAAMAAISAIAATAAGPAAAARICIARFDVCRLETDSVTCPATAPPARG